MCDHESVKKEFRKILSQKLKESLIHILDTRNLDQELKQKVQKFLNNELLFKEGTLNDLQEKKGKRLERRGEWVHKKTPIVSRASN